MSTSVFRTVLPCVNHVMVLSANWLHWVDLRHVGKSFINTRNNNGPSIDPWETPLIIGTLTEQTEPTL